MSQWLALAIAEVRSQKNIFPEILAYLKCVFTFAVY